MYLYCSMILSMCTSLYLIFLFNDTATTEIYTYGHTLSLHDALPIYEAALSPAARAFYTENRRVANGRAKRLLGWTPRYPTYREGLRAIFPNAPTATAARPLHGSAPRPARPPAFR